MRGRVRVFLSLFSFLFICMIIGAGCFTYYNLSKLNEKVEQGTESIPVIASGSEPINILALGVDIGITGKKSDPKRADTIMVIHYDPKVKSVDIVSIPRDTLVRINGRNEKINAAHAIGGVKTLQGAVEGLMNIKINYYVKINYEGFRKIIDSIGGVTLVINQNMKYDDPAQNLHIDFKKGDKVHLNGKKAEEFFRWRKNNDGSGLAEGDLGRIQNQHEFMEKVVKKFTSPVVIFRVPSIISTICKYTETNMDADEILKYGYSFMKLKRENIRMHTLKGKPAYIGKISYFIFKGNNNKEILEVLRGYNSPNVDMNNKQNKLGLKIKILNGTKKNGLAKNYEKVLNTMGYNDITTGNGPKAKKSSIKYNSINKNIVDSIAKEINISDVQKNSFENNKKYDIVILLGEDKDYIK